ncbi:odorant receptor 131-2-like [Nelusetta ayraudi]|uniref:odorant receptor 131-2-like n=1 Tax=Nelusetta ayraudi TaxID=303726 RepID=UPI003F717D65
MNVTSDNATSAGRDQESFSTALIKNLIVVLLGISINSINASLIYTFCKNQIFYMNPRYILFIHMVINDMIQVTLSVSLFVISYTIYTINVSLCCTLILLTLFTTENTPLNLACMVVECYIAICIPLRYMQICTVRRTLVLIGLIWATTMASSFPDLLVTLNTQPVDFFHSQVLCIEERVFPDPIVTQKRDVIYSVLLVVVWITIFYAYFRILFTAKAASGDAKKARSTVILHGFQLLLCMTTYVAPQLMDKLRKMLPISLSNFLFIFYIITQVIPRSISPFIYGIRDSTFRTSLKKYLFSQSKVRTTCTKHKGCRNR